MKTFKEIKEILKNQKPFLKEKYGVMEIGIFGSLCKGGAIIMIKDVKELVTI